ncbi:MAG: ABC transporter substrate-binding protein, partial [Pseudomonadota bacterium]
MRGAAALLASVLLLTGCGNDPAVPAAEAPTRPLRVVSLDYCADQYVLKLLDRQQILGVSPDATEDFSYMRETARGLSVIRPVAEDVLVMKPDLIVRAYGGGPNAAAFFEQAGIPVVNVGWASDIPAVFGVIESMAAGLGQPDRGAAVVQEMRDRLSAIAKKAQPDSALYMTPSGVTTGPGSLVHEILTAAGLRNFQEQPGWQPVPLERLAYETPDLVAAAFFDTHTNHPDAWSPMRHPVARAQLREPSTVMLEGAWTACSGWFLLDAVEA